MQATHSEQEIPVRGRANQHTDIFGAKNASHTVIRNPEVVAPQPNIFQQRAEEAYEKYQGSLKRPASSRRTSEGIRQDRYTYDSEWCNPKFQGQKTMVNEDAYFPQDYHHQRRLDELTSSIFVPEAQQEHIRRIYQKKPPLPTEGTRNPHSTANFGRRSTIAREYDNDQSELRKQLPNYSNLFGLNDRHTQSSKQLEVQPPPQPLIPNKMKWEQYDSVLQIGSKDAEVDGDFHKKRYYQNMKSSMDTHGNYENFMTESSRPAVVADSKEKVNILNQPIPQVIVYSENNQICANSVATKEESKPSVKSSRPQSSAKGSAKPVEITIVKGLSNKFSLPALSQQCKLHSLLLSKFSNEMNEGGSLGRGLLTVVPQKKFGLENLCSWLRAQGLTIRMK